MQLKYEYTGKPGYEAVVEKPECMKFINEFGVIKLGEVKEHSGNTGNCEAMLHIYCGTCTVSVGDKIFENIGGRENVFAGLPTAVYLPPNTAYKVTGDNAEVAYLSTESDGGGEVTLISRDDVKIIDAGKDNWSREVRLIAGPGNSITKKMVLGETINPPGNWSGMPPHKHENDVPPDESLHDELYLFRFDKPNGWGIERQYDEHGFDEYQTLTEDTVTIMPKGYHPVVAAPGYTLYYMFWLIGDNNALIQKEDERHTWIKE
ncbi:5-deoxy-glucuronate isomerase [Candidatus Hydrogenedentota bacterium]